MTLEEAKKLLEGTLRGEGDYSDEDLIVTWVRGTTELAHGYFSKQGPDKHDNAWFQSQDESEFFGSEAQELRTIGTLVAADKYGGVTVPCSVCGKPTTHIDRICQGDHDGN